MLPIEETPSPAPLPVTLPAVATSPAAPAFNWEAFMGVKLFAWLGGFALFLGVVFMVKYSFENNLITPLARVIIGGAIAGALASAVALRRTPETLNRLYAMYDQITPEDLREVARKYFVAEGRTVVNLSGPKAK